MRGEPVPGLTQDLAELNLKLPSHLTLRAGWELGARGVRVGVELAAREPVHTTPAPPGASEQSALAGSSC